MLIGRLREVERQGKHKCVHGQGVVNNHFVLVAFAPEEIAVIADTGDRRPFQILSHREQTAVGLQAGIADATIVTLRPAILAI